MKSPCLDCDHHLAGKDKSDRRCVECPARLIYVRSIGSLSASMEPNTLHGDAGRDQRIIEVEMSPEEEIQKAIYNICEKHKVDAKNLKNAPRKWNVNLAINDIVKDLTIHHKQTPTQIARYVGVTPGAIYQRKTKIFKNMKKQKSKMKKENIKTIDTPKNRKVANSITIDFADFPEIFDDLISMAREELRTPENQALYIFKAIHKRGLNVITE